MTDYKKFVQKHFMDAIKTMQPPQISSELKHQLLDTKEKHPRFQFFLENTAAELVKVQRARTAKAQKLATYENMRWLVVEMAKVFVHTIEVEAKRRMESDLKKLQREIEQQKAIDMEKTVNGEASGIYEEMGVKFGEEVTGPERDKQI